MTSNRPRLGVMFDRARPPESLIGFAREVDAAGLDELWVVEDLGWAGAVSAAATALASTDRITVGIGIVPAPFRNPALLAMELANLERLHPGRLLAGIGHGVGPWMAQVGAAAISPLTRLEETIVGVRALLAGELVTMAGRYVTLDGVQLVHPPDTPPPLLAGVMKPRSLRLSGRVADGTVLAEGTGPDGIVSALSHIAAASAHLLVVLTHLYIDDDAEAVRIATDPVRREFAAVQGVAPDQVFLAAGSAAVAAERIASLWAAGANSVVLRPIGTDASGQLTSIRRALTW